ncbi:MAG: hypothetical protein IKD66_14180 [Solobacterium sp.]|nr:hypothetical protein [Solobacterium sp.]
MKLRYFFSVIGLTTGIFLVLDIPAQIIFMILELQPYAKLAVVILLFLFSAFLVNRLVNYHWIERWTRQEAVDRGGVEAPEPEYVMDDEMVKKLTLREKLKKPLFGRGKTEEPAVPAAVVPTQPARAEVPAVSREPEPAEDDWKTPFEEQETMRFDIAEQAVRDLSEARSEALAKTQNSSEEAEKPAEPAKAAEASLDQRLRTRTEKYRRRRAESVMEKPEEEPADRKKKETRKSDASAKSELPAASWQVPFDEIPTGSLSSAMEKEEEPAKELKRDLKKETDAASSRKAEREEAPKKEKRRGLRNLFQRSREETVLEVKSEGKKQKAEKHREEKTSGKKKAQEENSTPAKPSSSWKVPFDEMPTADLSSVLEPSEQSETAIHAKITEEPPMEETAGPAGRLGRLFARSQEETVIEVHENKDASIRRGRREKSPERKAEKKPGKKNDKKPEKKTEKKSEKKAEKKPGRKPEKKQGKDERAKERKKPARKEESSVSSWSVPFDEMPTANLSNAVENARDGGYNPFNSDEGNK